MTDDQFKRIKKGLNFHSEGGVYNLCTLTETALREIIEDATKELDAQIERMKCCPTCDNNKEEHTPEEHYRCKTCKKFCNWELAD